MSKKSKGIPVELLESVEYSENSPSCLIWKRVKKHSTVKVNDSAGYLDSKNRWCIKYNKKLYKIHRVVWTLFNGQLDSEEDIDHLDRDSSNNKISNLRKASSSQNNCNKIILSTKKTDLPKGINFSKSPYTKDNYMVARIYINGKSFSKSSYELEELVSWLEVKRNELHKEFANNG